MNHLKSQLSDFSAVIVHFAAVVLLTHSCGGQSQMIGPSEPIVATVGDDVILPCHLRPAVDVVSRAVEWARPDLTPRFVHVRRDGVELLIDQNPSFLGRTSMSVDTLKCGDVSLKLSKVRQSDNGTYRCYVPELDKSSTVQLVVGVFSPPRIGITRDDSGAALMLDCESAGWYPDPEVLWLDGEGHVLSAGPTETVRGPDDLYTVSSRVTVDKRHSNSFTCRVQQNHISLTRNSHIHVADNVFVVQSCLTVRVIISLGVCFASVLIVVLIVCRCGHNKASNHHKTEAEFGELLDNNMKIQSTSAATEEKKLLETSERDGRLDKRNSSCDEEIEQVLGKLSEQKTKLKKQRELINSLLLDVNTQIAETKRKLENPASFDRERKQKKRETVKQDLERRKKEHEELLKITEELLDATDEMMIKFKVINKKLDKDE